MSPRRSLASAKIAASSISQCGLQHPVLPGHCSITYGLRRSSAKEQDEDTSSDPATMSVDIDKRFNGTSIHLHP